MQQILFIAGGALLALKDSVTSIKLSKQVKTIILAIAAYYLVNYFIKEYQKKQILDEAGNSPDTTFAIRLYAAFHPFVDWGAWFPDGTDEDEVIAVAKEMKQYKNYAAVSQKYRAIYSRELSTDLSDEGVYNLFFQNYN